MLDARVVAERRQRLARLKAVREQERAVARRTVRQFEAAKAAAVASTCATRRIEWESEKWAAVDELNGRCQAGLHCYGAAQSASDGAVKALRTGGALLAQQELEMLLTEAATLAYSASREDDF